MMGMLSLSRGRSDFRSDRLGPPFNRFCQEDTMKRLRFAIVTVILSATLCNAHAAVDATDTSFQIVESVPVATIYGQPGVPRTQRAWIDMLRGAKHSIDIAAFYISNKPGEALAPVIDTLVARAEAGVRVRILLDRKFLRESESSIRPLRGVPNMEIRVLPVDSLTGGVLHAKYFIVDNRSVFVGSQNWDWRALDQIHEIGARIENRRFARTFEGVFDFDWRLAGHPDLPAAAKAAVTPPDFAPVTEGDPVVLRERSGSPVIAFPAFSPPSLVPRWVTHEQPALVRFIESARDTLRIQVMTLSGFMDYGPKGYWPALDNALRDAAARGVKVEIIVADWALREPMQAYLKSLAVLPNITVKFSTLPRAPQGFIPYARVEHCKYAVADGDRSFIGTGNWSWSYFNTTIDASIFIGGRSPAETLTKIFDRDWNGPYVTKIDAGHTYAPPKIR